MVVNVKIWKDRCGFYHAQHLPGCRAVGMTQEEVREKIRVAVYGYVASFDAVRPVELAHELIESET